MIRLKLSKNKSELTPNWIQIKEMSDSTLLDGTRINRRASEFNIKKILIMVIGNPAKLW